MGGAAIFGLILLILGFILFAIGVYLYTSNDNNNLTTSNSNTEAYIFMILGGLFVLIGIIALVYGAYEGNSSDTKKDKKSKKDKQIEKLEKQNKDLKIRNIEVEKRNNDYNIAAQADAVSKENMREFFSPDPKPVLTTGSNVYEQQGRLLTRANYTQQPYYPRSARYPQQNDITSMRTTSIRRA